jgi:hypothetical protein
VVTYRSSPLLATLSCLSQAYGSRDRNTVARIITEPLSDQEKDQIVQELEDECSSGRGMATQFAQDAQQYTKPVEVPWEYQ